MGENVLREGKEGGRGNREKGIRWVEEGVRKRERRDSS